MSNCQNVNIILTDTRLISLEFPTSPYEQKMAIVITNNAQPLFSSCLHHRHYYKENGHSCTWVIGGNICGFVDYFDITCQDSACDSLLRYSLTRMLIPEDGGNTILRSFLNCAKSHKKRTVSTQQQHSSENLKSSDSKTCWLNWAIPLSLLSY